MRDWTENEMRAESTRVRVLIDPLRRGEHQGTVARTNCHVVAADAEGADEEGADRRKPLLPPSDL